MINEQGEGMITKHEVDQQAAAELSTNRSKEVKTREELAKKE